MVKVYFDTAGCSMNHSDSETMAGYLYKSGNQIVSNAEDAELIIVNGCNVKTPSANEFNRKIKKYENSGKKLILAGCVSQAHPEKYKDKNVVGTYQLEKINNALVSVLEDRTVHFVEKNHKVNNNDEKNNYNIDSAQNEVVDRLSVEKIRTNPHVEIIAINQGCLGSCSFCITKKSRGSLHSYRKGPIVNAARKAVNEGVKEIWLTSQDTACWGKDIKEKLILLMKELNDIEGDFKIRLGMGNPDHFKKIIPDLIEIFNFPKVYKFLHIPLQAGNNKVLKEMNRIYTKEVFADIIDKLRSIHPDLTIATDIICGFPGETDQEFKETLDFCREMEFDVMNISKFWTRPETKAAEMKQVPFEVIKKRGIELTDAQEEIIEKRNEFWLNWEGKITITEHGRDNTSVGRNYAYKPIVVKEKFDIGTKLNVRIAEAKIFHLEAEIINIVKNDIIKENLIKLKVI